MSENEDVKLLWDFSIQTDNVIPTRRLDIVLSEEERVHDHRCCSPCRLSDLEQGRGEIDKYTELAWELMRIWKVQISGVPIVIGALGTITTRHKGLLSRLEDSCKTCIILNNPESQFVCPFDTKIDNKKREKLRTTAT